MDPTERSISPVTRTNVIDTARTPMNEICEAMFSRFSGSTNVELISAKMVPVRRIAMIMPPSRKRWSRR